MGGSMRRIGTALAALTLFGCSGGGFGLQIENKPKVEPSATPTPTPIPSVGPTVTPTPTPTPIETTDHTDRFRQAYSSAGVDVLWVIDDSPSMSDKQDAIQANAALFTQKLFQAKTAFPGFEFHICVVSTATAYQPELHCLCNTSSGYLTSADITATDSAAFSDCVDKVNVGGTATSTPEDGLESSYRAMTSSWMGGNLNPTFLRSDASTSVIYVSDEESGPCAVEGALVSGYQMCPLNKSWQGFVDSGNPFQGNPVTQSMVDDLVASMGADILPNNNLRQLDGKEEIFPLVDNYVSSLKSLKADQPLVGHAVVKTGGPGTCGGGTIGYRYMDFADKTGGSVTDVCNNDWTSTLDSIGLQSTGLRQCFALSTVPTQTGSIQATFSPVFNPGTVAYRSAGNFVCFENLPPNGTDITVTYR